MIGLVINNAAYNGICPLCGARTEPDSVCAVEIETAADVCDACVHDYDPALFVLLSEARRLGIHGQMFEVVE